MQTGFFIVTFILEGGLGGGHVGVVLMWLWLKFQLIFKHGQFWKRKRGQGSHGGGRKESQVFPVFLRVAVRVRSLQA